MHAVMRTLHAWGQGAGPVRHAHAHVAGHKGGRVLPRPRDLAEDNGGLVRGAAVVEAVINRLAEARHHAHHLHWAMGGAQIGMQLQ